MQSLYGDDDDDFELTQIILSGKKGAFEKYAK